MSTHMPVMFQRFCIILYRQLPVYVVSMLSLVRSQNHGDRTYTYDISYLSKTLLGSNRRLPAHVICVVYLVRSQNHEEKSHT